MTADERDYLKKFGYLHPEEYFDIHGYKKKPEIFPGEWITAINNAKKFEDIWWTIEDFDYRGNWQRAVNAKSETITKVGMFKDAFRNDRVLIPATALFEWHLPDGAKRKDRYEIGFDEPIFCFAGVARNCEIKGETKRSGVIITTSPNQTFSWIHNAKQRQAVVVRDHDYDAWLDMETPFNELQRIMQPLPDDETHFKLAEM